MRENRPYGLEGGEAGSTGLPYPYAGVLENAGLTLRMSEAVTCPCFAIQSQRDERVEESQRDVRVIESRRDVI